MQNKTMWMTATVAAAATFTKRKQQNQLLLLMRPSCNRGNCTQKGCRRSHLAVIRVGQNVGVSFMLFNYALVAHMKDGNVSTRTPRRHSTTDGSTTMPIWDLHTCLHSVMVAPLEKGFRIFIFLFGFPFIQRWVTGASVQYAVCTLCLLLARLTLMGDGAQLTSTSCLKKWYPLRFQWLMWFDARTCSTCDQWGAGVRESNEMINSIRMPRYWFVWYAIRIFILCNFGAMKRCECVVAKLRKSNWFDWLDISQIFIPTHSMESLWSLFGCERFIMTIVPS